MSASMWPRHRKSIAWRWAKPGRGACTDRACWCRRTPDRRRTRPWAPRPPHRPPGRHPVALRVELEMVDQRLHRPLHGGSLRRHDLAVLVRHRADAVAAQQAVDALAHDGGGLAHLLHADHLAVVIVAVLADRDVEIHLVIAFVGLGLAQVPCGARATHHDPGKAPRPGVLERHIADVDVALLEDAVLDEQLPKIVDSFQEGVDPLADVFDQAVGQVLVDAARAEIRGVHARAPDARS